MIKSCKQCKGNCCKTGPGPYKLLSPENYLENYSILESYNTRCMALSENNECRIWKTKELPVACRVHICTNKIFSAKERKDIESVVERECVYCEAPWTLCENISTVYVDEIPTELWEYHCEVCGKTYYWKGSPSRDK